MQKTNVVYRPPDSDSEDEYDGFYFGDDIKKSTCRWTNDVVEDLLYDALLVGDLESFKQEVEQQRINVDESIKGGYTPLLYACRHGFLDIVNYLLAEKHASPNKHLDSSTPLMLACDNDENDKRKDSRVVEKLVQLLLKHGAEINASDKYGTTPFMIACKNGHTAAVRLMIKKVSFDDVDNLGCTPIFHAISNNHPEIVELLVKAGANTTIPNAKGYTPKQVAQFHGFYDLLELLPKQKESFFVPPSYLTYETLRDLIPRLFLKSECPEYFQEIYSILLALRLEKLLEFFAKEHISLEEFLCMSDERLEEIGIQYPIYRMKIQKGLLDFHLHHWNSMPVARVNKTGKDSFYDILMITASHLQNLVIMKSSLRYVKQNIANGKLGTISPERLEYMHYVLNDYRASLKELQATANYLSTFSPPQNPLYVDYDEIVQERKSCKIKRFFKYTTLIIGISVFVCLKIRIF